jgi:hypothetical protein
MKTIFSSPFTIGIATTICALLYFFLMTINPNLPPAMLFSLIIGFFAYRTAQDYFRKQKKDPVPIQLPATKLV